MPNTITRDEAIEQIQNFLNNENIQYNKSFGGSFGIYLKNPQLWATNARVEIKETSFTNGQFKVTISWSSSERSLAMAMSAVDTYQKAISIAARIQTFIDGLPTVVLEE